SRSPRRAPAGGSGSCAVLHPAVAEAAHRAGAGAVGLVSVDCAAGFDLGLDRVAVDCGDGHVLGEPSSPVRLPLSLVGRRPPPGRAVPEVVSRTGLDRDPLDVHDPDDVRWLRACLAPDLPDLPERTARLQAQVALARRLPALLLLRGEPVDLLAGAVARVPAEALPVVTTTWALSRVPPGRRPRFLRRLHEAAAGRPLAWVSVEGVGVAPGVPTLGDRPASGHSLVGLALLGGADPRVETVGRCWSRGRSLAWLAPP
ncbi:DUF2332 family protein, partial [Kineococcus sp. T13]|uniref:DUF2332 domain-containing protein n=1 Tax=Kineococcus vitellinus TaxID=2696565 RepID=UPI0014128FC1